MKNRIRDALFLTGLGLTATGLYLVFGLGPMLLTLGLIITTLTCLSVFYNKES